MWMRSFLVALSVLLGGCIQQIALNSIGGIMDSGFAVMNEEQDLDLADKSIASNLKLIESMLRKDPDNERFLLLASRGYSSYALGFVEDDSLPRASIFYLRARDYGLRILRKNRDFADAFDRGPEELRGALQSFSKDDVPAVFWTAIGWGSYVFTNLTEPEALADLPKIETMMEFVLATDSTYFYGGAHFFLGTLLATRPVMLGGNPERAKEHFERCLGINHGQFLMTYFYYARSYAVQTQNRELFEELLAKVERAPIDILPEARLSNAIAKRKSARLLSRVDELF